MKTIINFRDFGGYPALAGQRVKTGYLYRSGHLDRARRPDLANLHALGIKTLVDLRSEKERRCSLRLWPGARLVSLPMPFDEITKARLMPLLRQRSSAEAVVDMVAGVYRETVDRSCPQLAALFDMLALPVTYPVLIFCRAGRDRTGFASAVILRALGVGVGDVVQDYLRSNAYLLPQARRTLVLLKFISLGLFPTHTLRAIFVSRARYIHTVLHRIERKYGGIDAYLAQCGIVQKTLTAVRGLLVIEA